MKRRKPVRRRRRPLARIVVGCKVCNLNLARGTQFAGDAGDVVAQLLAGVAAHTSVCPGRRAHVRIDVDQVGGRRHGS